MANDENAEAQIKSKKPKDSAFKQQRLPAWQPVLTAGTVLPTFFIIGIAFIPVGVALLYFSDQVSEHIIDYTNCKGEGTDMTCADYLKNISTENRLLRDDCKCVINFTLDKDFSGKVYMYYGLTNYYQNHRRYVKSRDDDQLLGRLSPNPSTDCDPFRITETGNPIAPCGAIANSLFNDTFYLKSQKYSDVTLLNTEIAWPSDKKMKFKNPDGNLETALAGYSKPVAWSKELWQLDEKNPDNNGFQNEDLIVWMRTAALPSFRKLYRRIKHEQNFVDGLPKGNYTLTVDYHYSVSEFDGTKRMILSTTSLLGGKNPFLGIAYIVVGCICLLLGIVLLFIHIKCSKSTAEMINVNPRMPYS